MGCAPEPIIIERNITIYKYNTTYRNITSVMPCNLSCPEPDINTTIYDRDYVLGLIRQLKKYEKQQDRFINQSDCMWRLNKTKKELEACEEVMCYNWNISWC